MALPAGYSSDEDDLEGFENNIIAAPKSANNSFITPQAKEELKQNQFFLSLINGDVTEVQKKLREGLNANEVLKDNWSPLLLAASTGNWKITKLLVEHGADVNYDKDKYTVLMAACKCPQTCAPEEDVLNVVKLLADKGADVNAVNRKRITPLMYACSSGHLEVVKFLLPVSNKFATDNQGWNALFWAVNDNKPKIVELLLEEGFKETQLDVRNNTALSYAIAHDYEEVAQLFSSRQESIGQIYSNTLDQFESIFENLEPGERPQYLNEMYGILCGSKSEQTMPYFLDNNVDLRQLLCMTDTQLQTLGISLPFQRYRILNGLHRFHKHPFKQASIPDVQKSDIYSNLDTAKSVAAAVRQMVCMEASLQYLITNSHIFGDSIDKEALNSGIRSVRDRLIKVKSAAKALHRRARYWDYLNTPADLISKESRQKRRHLRRIFVVGTLLVPLIFVTYKFLK